MKSDTTTRKESARCAKQSTHNETSSHVDGHGGRGWHRAFEGWSTRKLAAASGYSAAHISLVRAGKRELSLKAARKLARVMKIPLLRLLSPAAKVA